MGVDSFRVLWLEVDGLFSGLCSLKQYVRSFVEKELNETCLGGRDLKYLMSRDKSIVVRAQSSLKGGLSGKVTDFSLTVSNSLGLGSEKTKGCVLLGGPNEKTVNE